jgi:hypothetical protein
VKQIVTSDRHPSIQQALQPVFAFSPSELDAKRAELAEAQQAVATLTVTDAESMAKVDAIVKAVKVEAKAIEEMRTSVTKPLNEILKTVNGWFRPLSTLCKTIEDVGKKEVGNYLNAERHKQEQAYQAAALAHQAGAHSHAAAQLAVASEAQTTAPQGTSVREEWRAEIFNPKIIPYDWTIPDEPRINAHAKATPADQEPTPIAGVRFVKVPVVAVRA